MTVEQAIIQYLLDQNSVTSLVGNRIYPMRRQQASALPAIVVNRIGGAPLAADDGEVGLSNPQLQIDCYGSTYSSAKNTAKAIVALLSTATGISGTINIQYVLLESERDFGEQGANQSEYLFRTMLEFTIWHDGYSA